MERLKDYQTVLERMRRDLENVADDGETPTQIGVVAAIAEAQLDAALKTITYLIQLHTIEEINTQDVIDLIDEVLQ